MIRGFPTNINIEELKQYLLNKNIPITNVTRIQNENGSLPMVRLLTKDPHVVSKVITNGISIGYIRYKVGESKSTGRPTPCKTFLKYHTEKHVLNFKCGNSHQNASRQSQINKSFVPLVNKKDIDHGHPSVHCDPWRAVLLHQRKCINPLTVNRKSTTQIFFKQTPQITTKQRNRTQITYSIQR